eukprot:COSAG02_NODE_122_length_35306_cov_98.280967_7_plen_310_part_00
MNDEEVLSTTTTTFEAAAAEQQETRQRIAEEEEEEEEAAASDKFADGTVTDRVRCTFYLLDSSHSHALACPQDVKDFGEQDEQRREGSDPADDVLFPGQMLQDPLQVKAYRIKIKAACRAGAETSSDVVGSLQPGREVVALEETVNSVGDCRIRVATVGLDLEGWISNKPGIVEELHGRETAWLAVASKAKAVPPTRRKKSSFECCAAKSAAESQREKRIAELMIGPFFAIVCGALCWAMAGWVSGLLMTVLAFGVGLFQVAVFVRHWHSASRPPACMRLVLLPARFVQKLQCIHVSHVVGTMSSGFEH